MDCLFCKRDASQSRSVEHIVPMSLGNTEHVLARGRVCDACNNYFSREVEKPFLDHPLVTAQRFLLRVPSRRGVIPPVTLEYKNLVLYHVDHVPKGVLNAGFSGVSNRPRAEIGTVIRIPADMSIISPKAVSRLLAKMAIEALAQWADDDGAGSTLHGFVMHRELDQLRDHARRGTNPRWPVSIRQIYDSGRRETDGQGRPFQTMHEYDFLVTSNNEWFFVACIFGTEFVINMGGPEIDGYVSWLLENNDASPLYR
jgi:hypothetical protein